MRRRGRLSLAFVLLACSCARVSMADHVVAPDYAGDAKRVFILDDVESSLNRNSNFGTAILDGIHACGVAAELYVIDTKQLDVEARGRAAIASFRPDLFLRLERSLIIVGGLETRNGSYIATANAVAPSREVWKMRLNLDSGFTLLTDRSADGKAFATKIIARMAADGVLKSCGGAPADSDPDQAGQLHLAP